MAAAAAPQHSTIQQNAAAISLCMLILKYMRMDGCVRSGKEKFSGKIAAPYGEYGNPLPKKRRPERQSRENFKCGLLYSHGNAWLRLTHTQKPYIKLLVSPAYMWC